MITAKMGQQGHLLTLAGNLWLHGGKSMADVKKTVGLQPKPGDENMFAPPPISRLNRESLAQSRRLQVEGAAIKTQLDAAQKLRDRFTTTAQGAALTSPDPKQRQRFASPEGIMQAADSTVNAKFPNLPKLQQRYDEIMMELMGLHTPQAGAAAGQGSPPVIPDTFGSPTGGVDMTQLNDIIERQNDMFDQMGDFGLGNSAGTSPEQ